MGHRPNKRLHALRLGKGMSRKALAKSIGVSVGIVKGWENGQVGRPRPANLGALGQVLGVEVKDLGFETTEAIASSDLGGTRGECVDRLESVLSNRFSPDTSGLENLWRQTHQLYRTDYLFPPHQTLPHIKSHLSALTDLLEKPHTARVWRQLAVMTIETATVAGWASWQKGNPEATQTYYQLALKTAVESEYPELQAGVLAHESYILTARQEHVAAEKLLREAQALAGTGCAGTRAWLAARQAQEASILGDRDTTLYAIERARTALEFSVPGERGWESDFLSWQPQRLPSMLLVALARIQHPEADAEAARIRAHLETAEIGNCLATLWADFALARGISGDFDDALACASHSLMVTARVGGGASARLRLEQLHRILPPESAHQLQSELTKVHAA